MNRGFDVPGGNLPMQSAINLGPKQVLSFPPISVINVKRQWIARDRNSRLLIAKETKAGSIAAMDESSCMDKRKDLANRLRNNDIKAQGTSTFPSY